MTARVTGAAGTPTGTVTFFADNFGRPDTVLATVAVGPDGTATFSTDSLEVGTHTITATYSGSDVFAPSSDKDRIEIHSAATRTTLTSTGVTGGPVELIATVAPVAPGGGVPTGAVRFLVDGKLLGVADLDAAGVAHLATTSRQLSGHTVTAVYSGSRIVPTGGDRQARDYLPSTSPPLQMT